MELLASQGNAIVDSGITSVIHPTGTNALSVACGSDPTSPGSTHVMFEINQTPVSNDIVAVSSVEWIPAIQLCSCEGPSRGSFQNVAYYGP